MNFFILNKDYRIAITNDSVHFLQNPSNAVIFNFYEYHFYTILILSDSDIKPYRFRKNAIMSGIYGIICNKT